jgi:outer membrane receptor for ferrienterochelin and colicin
MKHISNRKASRLARLAYLGSSLAVIAMATTLATPVAVWAQTSESTLRGTAPAGVTVVAKSVDSGAERKVTAGADGTYVIAGLPSGNYHVTAGDQQADVSLSVASVSVYDFGSGKAAGAGNATVVTVTGKRQTVETRSSQVNQIVTPHDIEALPQITRNFMEFADTVPGVQFTVASGHNTSLRGGAQLDSSVNVYIDGVDQKDYVGGGSGFAGSAGNQGNGDPGNPFPQLAIGEYKVVTSNYSAEYGDASSAVIIAQTKSGTNQFHGEIFGDYTNSDLRDKTPAEKAAGISKAKEPNEEYGAAFSGPIIKDAMHFFVTWEHKDLSDYGDVYPNNLTTSQAQALLPSSVGSQFGPTTNPFSENLYFGKIDYEPTDQDRIEASINYRLEHQITGGSGQAAKSTEAPYTNDVKREAISWQHSTDDWVNELRLSYQDTDSSTTTTSAAPQFQYIYFPNPTNNNINDALIDVGGPGSGVGAISSQKGFNLNDDLTFSRVSWHGDHTIKVGVGVAQITLNSQNVSSDLANATYYYAVTPSGVAANPDEVQYPDLTAGFGSANVKTNDKQFSAYIQDNWDVDEHLEINLGLRWDHEEVPAYLKYVTPANVVSAVNGLFPGTNRTYASVLDTNEPGAPAININDYLSNGSNRKAPNNFAPRLGFSYDLYGDGRMVFFGGYARSFNRNQYSTLALETTKIALNGNPQVYFPSAQTQDSFGPCATAADVNPANHCYAWDPKYLTPAGLATLQTDPTSHEVDLLNNNIKTPYSDQFSVGIRNRIGEWNTQATLSYVESFDAIVGHWGARYADGSYYQNGSQWGAQGVPGVGSLILWDNAGKDEDTQLSLAGQKPYTKSSGWSATISYTYSDAKQNNAAGGSNPYQVNNNQYLFDYPNPKDYPLLTSSAVPKHRLVATYTRDLPWDIQVAAKLTLATPTSAFGIFGCSNGASVCNPYGGSVEAIESKAPHNTLGYKDIDLQFTKNVRFPYGTDGYVRVDIINLFNWANYDPAAIQFPSETSTPIYTKGGPIVGDPFTIKLSTGVKF